MKKRIKLTEGPVNWTILKMALFMMIGMIGMVAFNLIDTFFVGRLGKEYLAAMTFTFPVVMFISSIALGLGIGTASIVSRAIGENDMHKVERYATDSLLLAFIIVVHFVVIGLFTIKPLFTLQGVPEELMPHVFRYMIIWYLGMPFVVIPMVGNNCIRSTGDTLIPSLIMLIAIIINLIFDPLLIYGIGPFPRLELAGAALATVFARMTTFTAALLILHFRYKMLSFFGFTFKKMLKSWGNMLFVGIPAAVTNLILPLSLWVITLLVAKFGVEAVAGLGVGNRVEMFTMTPAMAFGSVITPFVGQHLGAGLYKRMQRGVLFSQIITFCIGSLSFPVFLILAKPIAGIFNSDPDVIKYASYYLYILSASYGFYTVVLLTSSAFNGMNKPFFSAIVSLARMIMMLLLAIFGSMILKVKGIFGAMAVSTILTAVPAFFWLQFIIHNRKKRNNEHLTVNT